MGRLFTRQVGNTPPGSSAERGALPGAPRTPLTGCPGGGGPGGGRGPGGGCGPGTALRMPGAPCRAGVVPLQVAATSPFGRAAPPCIVTFRMRARGAGGKAMGMPCGRKYPHPLRPLACSAAFHLGAEGEGPRARPGARAARVVLRVVAELAALAIAACAAGHELPAHLGPQLGRLAARAARLACALAPCHAASDKARACAAQADAVTAPRLP